MQVYFVFTDDWEIAGDGSGTVRDTLVRPAWRLMEIFERFGARYTIMAEVMHYLTMQAWCTRAPELEDQCKLWEQTVEAAALRGHDVQLHLHPQWTEAAYSEDRWTLGKNWSLPRHDEATIQRMVEDGRATLESLIQRHRPAYRCHCFRSGSWAMLPSDPIVPILLECGIDTDVSVVRGTWSSRQSAPFDYRDVEEGFAPYWADHADVRRRARGERGGFLEIPTQVRDSDARLERLRLLGRLAGRAGLGAQPKQAPSGAMAERGAGSGAGSGRPLAKRLSQAAARTLGFTRDPRPVIFDIASLSLREMKYLTGRILEEAALRLRGSDVALPIVLACHSKRLLRFDAIEAYLDWLLRTHGNVVCLKTLSEASRHLRSLDTFPWEGGAE
jgi:hypothetical protein